MSGQVRPASLHMHDVPGKNIAVEQRIVEKALQKSFSRADNRMAYSVMKWTFAKWLVAAYFIDSILAVMLAVFDPSTPSSRVCLFSHYTVAENKW